MTTSDWKRSMRSLFFSTVKFYQPFIALQAISLSAAMAARAEAGGRNSDAVLDDGGAGLTSFVWSDPKVRKQKIARCSD